MRFKFTNWRLIKRKRYKEKPLKNGDSKKRGICNGNGQNGKISK